MNFRPLQRCLGSDIWAFGCVLYELLSGRVAFDGETLSDTIAAVIEREPNWAVLPPAIPAPVLRLLQRCLEKNPKRRLRDIGDAIDELDRTLPPASRARSSRRPFWLPATILGTLVISALVGWVAWEMKPSPQLTVTRLNWFEELKQKVPRSK